MSKSYLIEVSTRRYYFKNFIFFTSGYKQGQVRKFLHYQYSNYSPQKDEDNRSEKKEKKKPKKDENNPQSVSASKEDYETPVVKALIENSRRQKRGLYFVFFFKPSVRSFTHERKLTCASFM